MLRNSLASMDYKWCRDKMYCRSNLKIENQFDVEDKVLMDQMGKALIEMALSEQLKERQEMEKIRLQRLAKCMDYMERAKREEETPLFDFLQRLEEEKITHELEQLKEIELSKQHHAGDIQEKNRLARILDNKDTRDIGKEQLAIRKHAFSIIASVFERHGAVSLYTPVFDIWHTLMGKCREDVKLMYDFADQGDELCSLRYDLTIPFARYLAMNKLNSLKGYQIAKVHTQDNPSKRRYCEFYQCDLVIAGQCELMRSDFEVLKVLTELLDELNIGDYEIRLNHRKLLDCMLDICGVSSEKFMAVCSSIGKLDKQSFEQVKKELVEEKGLAVETADKIGTFVKKRGPPLELLSELKEKGSSFLGNLDSVVALSKLEILFIALEKSKCLEKIVFDLSLARGLDYYTGVIFEAVFKGSAQVGSIAAGGRYDNLLGMRSRKPVPAVGVSLGIERVFTIMEQLGKEKSKGTPDFGKEQIAIREHAFSIITSVFKRHGAVSLDTPVFKLRETLMGKYGEDSKLTYDLPDQGGELCSLRYELTLLFARYLAMNNINSLKRYQIAKLCSRDNPSEGRYHEFYQCGLEIAGQREVMESDFEVLKVLTELLDELNVADYEIKLNHRKLLDGMLEICGVSSEKFKIVCSSIAKLDKQSFEQVKKELVEENGLSAETADKIGTFVKKRGSPLELLSELKDRGSSFLGNNGFVLALNELEILFNALEKSKCLEKIVFDLSLARGLDYYTGVIFEAVFKCSAQVVPIAAGGRYDNLLGMLSGKPVPAVGVRLGIERVFTIMEQFGKEKSKVIGATETQVLVAILGKDLSLAAELVNELWNAKVKAEFALNKSVRNYSNGAVKSGIPWVVYVGESELRSGFVKLKNIESHQEEMIPRKRFAEEVQKRLNMV